MAITFLRAIVKISLILAAPLFSLSVNSAPEANTKGKPLSFASVLANSVLPVPGGPERRIPCQKNETPLELIIINKLILQIHVTITSYSITRTNCTSFSKYCIGFLMYIIISSRRSQTSPPKITSLYIDFDSTSSPTGYKIMQSCNKTSQLDKKYYALPVGEWILYQNKVFCICHVKQLIILLIQKTA